MAGASIEKLKEILGHYSAVMSRALQRRDD